MFLFLFLLGFSVAGMRNLIEAASNTASTLLEHAHIIDHTFRVYKCACTNIKVGGAGRLRRENLDMNEQQMNEGSNIQRFFPACTNIYT